MCGKKRVLCFKTKTLFFFIIYVSYKIQISITNDFGTFKGESMEVTEEQYIQIKKLSKDYYTNGFEMTTESGGFMIIPPDIIKKSLLTIEIIK